MKRRAKKRLWLILSVIAALLLTAAGVLYWHSRPAPPPTFDFLTGRRLCHEGTRKTSASVDALTVYCFTAYHDSVYRSARKELLALGYTEITPPIDYSAAGHRFDPRDRNITSMFHKRAGRTSLRVRIAKGQFIEADAGGALRFTADLDWVHVVITRSRQRFSLRRELRRCWNKLAGKPTPPPTPGPTPTPVPGPPPQP